MTKTAEWWRTARALRKDVDELDDLPDGAFFGVMAERGWNQDALLEYAMHADGCPCGKCPPRSEK